MKISREVIKGLNIRGFLGKCIECSKHYYDALIIVKDGGYYLENMQIAMRDAEWKLMSARKDETRKKYAEEFEKCKDKYIKQWEEVRANLWMTYLMEKKTGVKMPFRPWEIEMPWELKRVVDKMDIALEEMGDDRESEDNLCDDETASALFEKTVKQMKWEDENLTFQFCAKDIINENKLKRLEATDFSAAEYILHGEIYTDLYKRGEDWRGFVKELATMEYYKDFVLSMSDTTDTEQQNNEETKPEERKTSVRSAVKMLYDWGYFERMITEGVSEVKIGEEISKILGCTPNFGRKIYRVCAGKD